MRNSNAGWSKERGSRHSERQGHFSRGSCAHRMNETQNRIRIREPVKTAARTDTVAGIRLNRCGMIDDRAQRRKNRRMRPVTQVAMRSAYRQPSHHHAQQPRGCAGCGFDGWLHSRIILPQVHRRRSVAFRDSLWIAPEWRLDLTEFLQFIFRVFYTLPVPFSRSVRQ